jgi:hypothetical protein
MVQLRIFGRELVGEPDTLTKHRMIMSATSDDAFAAKTGARSHRNLESSGVTSDFVAGTVFAMTQDELERADSYEPGDYGRVLVTLRSGTTAWVYMKVS